MVDLDNIVVQAFVEVTVAVASKENSYDVGEAVGLLGKIGGQGNKMDITVDSGADASVSSLR